MPPQISLAMELALNEAIDSGESVISIAKKYELFDDNVCQNGGNQENSANFL